MAQLPDPRETVAAQDEATVRWHRESDAPPAALDVDSTLLVLHKANFDLWHLEDAVRDPRATDREIVERKRGIDRVNQQRCDCVEQVDAMLLASLMPNELAPLHTETPGMIFDRLSILSLKLFHTAEESRRATATAEHRARNCERLAVLERQRADLLAALLSLFADMVDGRRRFKLYRQLKMYNDPALNPVLYGADAKHALPEA